MVLEERITLNRVVESSSNYSVLCVEKEVLLEKEGEREKKREREQNRERESRDKNKE